jgi:hypothetical protein
LVSAIWRFSKARAQCRRPPTVLEASPGAVETKKQIPYVAFMAAILLEMFLDSARTCKSNGVHHRIP